MRGQLAALVCGEPGCDRPVRCRSLCGLHYKRQYRAAHGGRDAWRAPGQAYARSRTGVRGVSFDRSRGKWVAQVQHRGRQHNLGRYGSIGEAAAAVARKRAALAWADQLARERARAQRDRERSERLQRVWAEDVRRAAHRASWAHR